ncbi:MAG: Gfo/Idh/MocA family oxidoreductase [Kiritimatiellia bacterium]
MNRRHFLGNTLALSATTHLSGVLAATAAGEAPAVPAPAPKRKIKTGFIGGGGRGAWIAGLFQQHGGYEAVAVADYFKPVAGKLGDALGVDAARRFSGLSGYQRVIESGIEALVIEDVPYFYPEQARAALEAGLHIYMAKPVAVDAPGCLAIEDVARKSTAKQRVFLVDYQIPTDPVNLEVAKRIREGGLGKLAQVQTTGMGGGFNDPPLTATVESRLQSLVWVNDTALGCGNIGNYDIHAIDAAIWVIGQRPVAAMGASRICRSTPHGDAHDVTSVVFEYADGLLHNHIGQALKNNNDGVLSAVFHGPAANATITYWGRALVRGGNKHFGGGPVENLYAAGATRNIAEFHDCITGGRFGNESALRAVDSCLACILGREAALRNGRLTLEELLRENKRLEVNLSGLQA